MRKDTSSPSSIRSAVRIDFLTGRTNDPVDESGNTEVDQVESPTTTRTFRDPKPRANGGGCAFTACAVDVGKVTKCQAASP